MLNKNWQSNREFFKTLEKICDLKIGRLFEKLIQADINLEKNINY